jgi:hypothetical protein
MSILYRYRLQRTTVGRDGGRRHVDIENDAAVTLNVVSEFRYDTVFVVSSTKVRVQDSSALTMTESTHKQQRLSRIKL